MIRTSVVPCLSSGLAKNNKIMPKFALFPGFFGHFESLASFRKWGGQALHQNSQTRCFSRFFKGTEIKWQFFQEVSLFRLKSEDKLNRRYISKTFSTKTMLWLFGLFSWDYIDVWMIEVTIKTNQIDMGICFFQK